MAVTAHSAVASTVRAQRRERVHGVDPPRYGNHGDMASDENAGNPLGWGKAEEEAKDPDVQDEVEDAQVRDRDRPPGREDEHQPEERDRGA